MRLWIVLLEKLFHRAADDRIFMIGREDDKKIGRFAFVVCLGLPLLLGKEGYKGKKAT
jgi:hypothetical protein